MWKDVPDPKESWEYLQAGLLFYGHPDSDDDDFGMRHYDEETVEAWIRGGYNDWVDAIADAPNSGYRPNHIYLED